MNKRSTLMALAALLSLSSPAHAELSKGATKEGKNLITFYKTVTGWDQDELPLSQWQSHCVKSVCAFNYETDREPFGLAANVIYAGEDEVIWTGFRSDPNGVFTDGDELDLSVTQIEKGEILTDEHLKAIGDSFQKGLTAIAIEVGPILVEQSRCKTSGDHIVCALNFETDRENFGIRVEGLISSDKNSIAYIEVLDTDPNGV